MKRGCEHAMYRVCFIGGAGARPWQIYLLKEQNHQNVPGIRDIELHLSFEEARYQSLVLFATFSYVE